MEKKRIIPKGLWFILIPTVLGVLYYFVVIDIWLKKPITGIYHNIVTVDSLRNEIRFFHDYYSFEFAGVRLGKTQKVSVFSIDSLRVISSKENISGVPEKSNKTTPTFTLQGSPDFLSTDFAIAVGTKTTTQRFIKPMIIYQDAHHALVLHQTTHFDESDRMLSFVSDSAAVVWTAPQAILFPELEVNPNITTSAYPVISKQLQTFSTKNSIILSYNFIGFIIFDKTTGQERFYYHK
jgi:hypothetical protein